ncbi:maltose alpha-D-glucosyltransferase [Leptolyngbya sp. 'hensonii']|uniref:maltose alpha-D-glucosyltransferase n=1 Tax=Leptolyngbya sp. 'hensonii' TaxID=1922337 RepID=UPI00094F67AD|nr:maltose alpha-D-glucosyltransferase [Leptolyngbya sp. 'hensonii']OLP20464.1 maltose alpha-D-glucosyltransferase [Leptolyngbya sp. 'hensonii']
MPLSTITPDPLWFKTAIIYEVPVRAFADSNGDGIGDFRGLTEKLDYLQDLGVTALWVLPFFPSPLRDDGYDIADYTSVNPIYGTLDDFRTFLTAAHQREIRVIIELIINHTSDQHPWFQRARRAPADSPERDFYVWSDTAERYQEARIIFQDFETSNWTWDPIPKAYYWHRFYSHQPDLNYDNPAVQQAVFQVLDFWLAMGVDGLRMDAVPYLYEREGTNCENLPETHAFLKQLRQYVDQNYPNRMLLAEANQWPEDAAAYYGAGDECHMNFHFPLMPRLFMSLRMEDSFPITDILQQTPPIPDNCQWGLFLRNHDELTLEMVTDEDRDYMYRVYAQDLEMRVNLGIRRRLAPLLGNDRRQIELLNSLLLSLPGTPVLYYGDEIGMGDNVYIGDRNGVRTPMQWSADRNAGFSRANPHRLYLPLLVESEYHYEAVNVEAQRANPNSLWHAMRRLIATRKRFQALGKGSFEFLHPDNRKVLAFTRTYGEEHILVVANLSRFVQMVDLDLTAFKGMVPVEIFGRTEFPVISEAPYFLSIAPYAFYWFTLKLQPAQIQPRPLSQLPTLKVRGQWQTVFSQRNVKQDLELLLPDYLMTYSWYGGRIRPVQSVHITEAIEIPGMAGHNLPGAEAMLVWLQVDYIQGNPETYLLCLTWAEGEAALHLQAEMPQTIVARLQVEGQPEPGILCAATTEKTTWMALLETIAHDQTLNGRGGKLLAKATERFVDLKGEADHLDPQLLRGEHGNTLMLYWDSSHPGTISNPVLLLKLLNRVEAGVNPDLEIRRFLDQNQRFPQISSIAGWLEYRPDRAEPMTIGILQEYIPDARSSWDYTLDRLRDYFELVTTHKAGLTEIPVPEGSLLDLQAVFSEPEIVPERDSWEPGSLEGGINLSHASPYSSSRTLAQETLGSLLANAQLLGQRTAELHCALASDEENLQFIPEPFTSFYQRSVYQYARNLTGKTLLLLKQRLRALPPESQVLAQQVLGHQEKLMACFQPLLNGKITALRTRYHGNYHLGQVLYTGKDFIVTDFGGSPRRTLNERRMKRSPLRDVAGLLQSFSLAIAVALHREVESGLIRPEQLPVVEQWKHFLYQWTSAALLQGYLTIASQDKFLPQTHQELQILLDVYLLEKAMANLSDVLHDLPSSLLYQHPERLPIALDQILQLK